MWVLSLANQRERQVLPHITWIHGIHSHWSFTGGLATLAIREGERDPLTLEIEIVAVFVETAEVLVLV